MFVLDTDVVSELRKRKPHGGVLAWIRSVPESALNVSVLSLFEMQTGVEKTRETDVAKAKEIENYVERCQSMFNVIDIDADAARLWAKLMHRRSADASADALIAATTLTHRMTIVTRNMRDFQDFGVPILDPFTP